MDNVDICRFIATVEDNILIDIEREDKIGKWRNKLWEQWFWDQQVEEGKNHC